MAGLVHELWVESDGEQTFCLAGPMGDNARKPMLPAARLAWTVEASRHFEAMTKYYEHMEWDVYMTGHVWHYEPYPEEWLTIQRGSSSQG
jgi:hypothetical protein